jgi:hypothetical protein
MAKGQGGTDTYRAGTLLNQDEMVPEVETRTLKPGETMKNCLN